MSEVMETPKQKGPKLIRKLKGPKRDSTGRYSGDSLDRRSHVLGGNLGRDSQDKWTSHDKSLGYLQIYNNTTV